MVGGRALSDGVQIDGVQEVEETVGVLLNTVFMGGPSGEGNGLLEILDLKPILDIDGQEYTGLIQEGWLLPAIGYSYRRGWKHLYHCCSGN